MARSVSRPHDAAVVCFQYLEPTYFCETCFEGLDGNECPNDTSDHEMWYDFEHDEWFCEDCDKCVDRDHTDPHNVSTDDIDWDNFVEGIIWRCQDAWPSMERIDRWIGDEDHAFLENCHARIGISEYCNIVSIWIVPLVSEYYPQHASLSYHWISQIEPRFREMFGQLRSIGRFSNGEEVFQCVT